MCAKKPAIGGISMEILCVQRQRMGTLQQLVGCNFGNNWFLSAEKEVRRAVKQMLDCRGAKRQPDMRRGAANRCFTQ